MKLGKSALTIGSIVLGGISITLVFTNPKTSGYQEYAVQRLTIYAKEKGCSELSQQFGGNTTDLMCRSLIDASRPALKQLIGEKTVQKNYLLFSIYQTDLSIAPGLPSYHFETVGILQRFITFKAEKL